MNQTERLRLIVLARELQRLHGSVVPNEKMTLDKTWAQDQIAKIIDALTGSQGTLKIQSLNEIS